MVNYIRQNWEQIKEMDIFARLCLLFSFFLSWQVFGIPNTFIVSDALVLITFTILTINQKATLFKFTSLEKGLFVFLFFISCTLIFHHEWISINEIIKFYYLSFLFLVMSRTISISKVENQVLINDMAIAMLFGAIISLLISIVVQYTIAPEAKFIDERMSFPYFGHIYRIRAFTAQPGNLATILCIGVLFIWNQSFKYKWLLFFISFVLLIFTFSKGSFLLCLVILLIELSNWSVSSTTKTIFSSGIIMLGLIFFILPTVYRPLLPGKQIPKPEQYQYGKNPITIFQKMKVYGSSYYYLKNAQKKLLPSYFIRGVGPAKFPGAIDSLKKEGMFPKHISSYSPHDSYLGTVVEYGLFGVIGFLALGYITFLTFFRQENNHPLVISIGACLLFILLHGTMTDDHHYRHFWLVLVFLNVLSIKNVK